MHNNMKKKLAACRKELEVKLSWTDLEQKVRLSYCPKFPFNKSVGGTAVKSVVGP